MSKACSDIQLMWTVCVRVCVVEARQKVLWQTVERTNCCSDVSLGEKVSEVPQRSEDTCASLPYSLLPFPPSLPSSLPSLPPFSFSFHPAQSAALWLFSLWFLAPHYWRARLTVCACMCLRCGEARFPCSNMRRASHTHTHSRQTDRWVNTHTDMFWYGNQMAERWALHSWPLGLLLIRLLHSK